MDVIENVRQLLMISTSGDMRTAMKPFVSAVLEDKLHPRVLARDFDASPLIGTGPKQINPRKTHSGLVNSIGLPVLANIAYCWAASVFHGNDSHIEIAIMRLRDAIKCPAEHGTETSSSKSTTGYLFGHHKDIPDGFMAEVIAQAQTKTGIFEEAHMKTEEITIKHTFPTDPMEALCIMSDVARRSRTVLVDTVLEAIKAVHFTMSVVAEQSFSSAEVVFRDPDREPFDVDEFLEQIDADKASELRAAASSAVEYIRKLAVEDVAKIATTPRLVMPDSGQAMILDAVLKTQGLPCIEDMVATINTASSEVAALELKLSKSTDELTEARKAASKMSMAPVAAALATTSGPLPIPAGNVVTKNAAELFGITGTNKHMFDFDMVMWEWEGTHPHVPPVDPDYIFRPEELLRCLFGIMTNQRAYLYGHTGTGKTTLVEQICAVLLWPFMRVNFDSEITRMDLIGRDVLSTEDGVTVSSFADGILPQAMSGPYMLCCDEIDFVRPDVAYVMQRALEGNGLLLTEDGGRLVKPHQMFRMFATGNTQGQGDEHGMYAGARPQSLALLDRFTVWAEIDYLDAIDRNRLIKRKVPNLDEAHRKVITSYVTEHLAAFKSAKVLQPMSPRGMVALANAVAIFGGMSTGKESQKALKRAFDTVVLARASSTDRAVLSGIVDRVVA